MANGIYRRTRAELEALAADAAERKAWTVFNRLVAEISCRDRHDRDDTEPQVIRVEIRDAVPVAA